MRFSARDGKGRVNSMLSPMDSKELKRLRNLAQKERLIFKPSQLTRSNRFGEWDSTFSGEGLDFEKIREAEPGEGVRRVHTPASTRFGRPMVIERTEQHEVKIFVVADATASMYPQDKMRIAFGVTCLILHAALKMNTSFGLGIYNSHGVAYVLPRGGPRHFYRSTNMLIEVLCGNEKKANFLELQKNEWWAVLRHNLPSRCFIFFISDFLCPLQETRDTFQVLAPHFEVIPVIVQNDLEYSYPSIQDDILFWAQDAETNETCPIQLTPDNTRLLREKNEMRFSELLTLCREFLLRPVHLKEPDFEKMREELMRLSPSPR